MTIECGECERVLEAADIAACSKCLSQKIKIEEEGLAQLKWTTSGLKEKFLSELEKEEVKETIKTNTDKFVKSALRAKEEHEKMMAQDKTELEEDPRILQTQSEYSEDLYEAVFNDEQEAIRKKQHAINARTAELMKESEELDKLIGEERMRHLANIKKCFAISVEKSDRVSYMRMFHFRIPMDGNLNRLAPDDLNAVLGHISMITVHVARVFGIDLPFELIPCRPITYFKLTSKENAILWVDPKDALGKGIARFVTAIGLLNFCLAWIASILLPQAEIHSWDGFENLWAILHWTADKKMHAPTAVLADVLRETVHTWNVHTGDGVAISVPFDRLQYVMRTNLSQIKQKL